MRITGSLSLCAAVGTLVFGVGCGRGASAASASASAEGLPSVPARVTSGGPVVPRPASPAAIATSPKPPFETLVLKESGKKGANNWPRFEAYNTGIKTVTFVTVYGYAYDKEGRLVARTTAPYNWSTMLKPGSKTDWDIDVGTGANLPPPEAVAFELCYSGIRFEGEMNNTEDAKRCGDKRPKGRK
jgi:hypothetical protein